MGQRWGTDRGRTLVAWGLVAILILAGVHSWSRAFLIDDAFISFRYARNLVEGRGLVFNPGERVEGYTNFLWTLLSAAAIRAGIDPEIAMPPVGIACSVLALCVLFLWGRALGLPGPAALVPPAMLAVNRSWAAWATGGLETRMFTLLVLATGWLLCRERTGHDMRRSPPLSALAAGLACLTRPEGWLVAAVAAASLPWRARAAGSGRRIAWCATAALIAGAHLAWRVAYYGGLLPNSFHAKVPGLRVASGALYLGLFALHHLAAPAAVLVILLLRRSGTTTERTAWTESLRFAVPLVFLFLLYTLLIGGDHFEFRFVDHLLPVLFLLIVLVASPRIASAGRGTVAAATLLVAAGAVSTLTGFRDFDREIAFSGARRSISIVSVETEAAYLAHWARMGRWLGAHAGKGESCAVAPAGAIPWYSGLKTLDMLGINDRELARMPAGEGLNIGHERMAGIDLIRERGITYLIGSPEIRHTRSTEYTPDIVEVHFGDFYWYFRVLIPGSAIRPGTYR